MNILLLLQLIQGVTAIIQQAGVGGKQDQQHVAMGMNILNSLLMMHPASAAAMTADTTKPAVGSPAQPLSQG